VKHLRNGTAPDRASREAADRIRRYFSTAAHDHHQDEELDLFPLLQSRMDVGPLIHDLSRQHRMLERIWLEMDPVLHKLASGLVPPQGFRKLGREFAQSSHEHVRLENLRILPLASSLLDARDLRRIGEAMARRRGLTASSDPPDPAGQGANIP
jgi:hemerythrin-like domain-containing protein